MTRGKIILGFTLLIAFVLALQAYTVNAQAPAATGKDAVLTAKELAAKLLPDKVFFRGQLAPVQLRNSGGVRFADNFFVVATLCDSSGYATEVREKFQGYLLTEVPLQLGAQTLKPGAYGFGFLTGNQFVVQDIGAHDLFQVASARDAEMKRPVPLQVLAGAGAGSYRLYAGREYVEFSRAQ
jgi:hypothetical protein